MENTLFPIENNKPTEGIAVDCSVLKGNPGIGEYQGIDIASGKILFSNTIPGLTTSNIAEFLAIISGVDYLIKNNLPGKVYSDSKTALAWYYKKIHNSALIKSPETEFSIILLSESINQIPKEHHMDYVDFWNNKIFGENLADYGRK